MLSHAPDLLSNDPEIIYAMTEMTPTADGGYRPSLATGASGFATALSGTSIEVVGAFFALKPDGTSRLFFGSPTRLFEGTSGTTWTDRSSGGSAYTTVGSWHFVQYGGTTYAASIENVIQKSTTGAFSAETNAPKAKIVEALEGALIALNYDDGSAVPNGISISDIDDPTTWAPAVGNTAYKVTLTDTPGPITAGIKFRDFIVAFKGRAMYLLQLISGPPWWEVRLFSADVGCVGKDACIVAKDVLYFVDSQGVYSFDGATVRPIDSIKIKNTFYLDMLVATVSAQTVPSKIQAQYDDKNQIVSFYAKASTPGAIDSYCWPYNVATGEWGRRYSGFTGGKYVSCVLRANGVDLDAFSGAPDTSQECRPVFFQNGSNVVFQNGHGLASMGTSSTMATFSGDPDVSRSISRLYFNIDGASGMSVQVKGYRARKTTSAAQSDSGSIAVNATDFYADVRAMGNFLHITVTYSSASNGNRIVGMTPAFSSAVGRK